MAGIGSTLLLFIQSGIGKRGDTGRYKAHRKRFQQVDREGRMEKHNIPTSDTISTKKAGESKNMNGKERIGGER